MLKHPHYTLKEFVGSIELYQPDLILNEVSPGHAGAQAEDHGDWTKFDIHYKTTFENFFAAWTLSGDFENLFGNRAAPFGRKSHDS